MDSFHFQFGKLLKHRDNPLVGRFPGPHRALVVETNDPLGMHRVRFKCPELHDWSLKAEQCPWAVAAPDFGSKGSGRWSHPCIGDWVWIAFEKNHPYGPVWTGLATPSRRQFYPLPGVAQPTPLSVDEVGQPSVRPADYNKDYLPQDGRPMSHGWQDRYGNADIHSSVGFFPTEHAQKPAPPDVDPLQKGVFEQATAKPAVNAPDCKFMARITKYGNMSVLGDQGYWWKKEGETGEFSGSHKDDRAFEIARWRYLQRLLNEDKPAGGDQRQHLDITRAGHRFEMRDTGWAQPGPFASKSRAGEYGDPAFLSKERALDLRWMKQRTKGGWLLQAYDKGYDPENDEYYSRLLVDEIGTKSEREDVLWGNKDARWFRIMGRHFKFVIDERGTDPRRAATLEVPRGNGILLKGRRTPGTRADGEIAGDPRGFYWEFNENNTANHTTWGSPLGQAIEMNDATEYMALCVGLPTDYATTWRGIEENEFLLEPTRARDPETNAYHFVMDHENEYARFKTRAGRGRAAKVPLNPSTLADADFHQGIEMHDGSLGDGPWTELIDSQGRGLWLSRTNGIGVWRASAGKNIRIWIDDVQNNVVINNSQEGGRVRIFCAGNVEVVSSASVTVRGRNVNIKADEKIRLDVGGSFVTFMPGRIDGNVGPFGGGGEAVAEPADVRVPAAFEPSDRGRKYNVPSITVRAEVEHPTV